jgi:acetyl esterase/lipase
VGSGQVGVFVEYTPLPAARFPTQLDESYAALKWVAAHAGEFGADGARIAVAGNSVGGDMSAALTLMTKDRKGPKISYQVLFIPATDASVDSASYHEFATGRFLSREFMKYGWDRYATDEKTRNNPYVSPLRASREELAGLPPALVITAENDPLRDEGRLMPISLRRPESTLPLSATTARFTISYSSTRFGTYRLRRARSGWRVKASEITLASDDDGGRGPDQGVRLSFRPYRAQSPRLG